jgi:SEL1 protein
LSCAIVADTAVLLLAPAVQMYGEAAKHHNAQALFNMGLLHQFGAGLPRDFHLAKRCYDR